jgi:hypothetical protein
MKKRLNITIDEAMFRAFKMDVKSPSGIINELLKETYLKNNQNTLVGVMSKRIKEQLLEDQSFIEAVRGDKKVILDTKGTPLNLESACCKLPDPCKHWIPNQIEEVYINALTGERREYVQ